MYDFSPLNFFVFLFNKNALDYCSKYDKILPVLTLTNNFFVLGECVHAWMTKSISFGLPFGLYFLCPVFTSVGVCICMDVCMWFCLCVQMFDACVWELWVAGLPRRCRQAPDGCRAEKGNDGYLAKLVAEDTGPAGYTAQG